MANKGGFSWKRALGVTRAKRSFSRKIGVPLTRSGRQRKAGAAMGCLVPILVLLLLLIAAPLSAIDVLINDSPLQTDVPAQVIDGRTMVPMRPIFESLGATVKYDESSKTIIGVKGGTFLVVVIGRSTDGMDVPAQLIDGRTMVPLRWVGESLGATVDYRDGVVYISTPNASVSVLTTLDTVTTSPKQPLTTTPATEVPAPTTLPPAAPVITTTIPPTTVPVITSTTPPTTMPVVTTTPPTTQPQTVSQTVYITRTGEKYHRDGCRYLRQSRISISLDDARRSYEPCSVCRPPQ